MGERPGVGSRIVGVDSVGKYLLHRFADGLTLSTHLGMTGEWRLVTRGGNLSSYELLDPPRAARPPAHLVRVELGLDEYVAYGLRLPFVRGYRDATASPVALLGPDLCREDIDFDEALRRMDVYSGTATDIATVLLNQRVVCGIGNVYKSEVLFACNVLPTRTVGSLDLPARRQLFETASLQLRANLGRARRSTTAAGGLAVYGRAGRPCITCRKPIKMEFIGIPPRGTYWCATCQS